MPRWDGCRPRGASWRWRPSSCVRRSSAWRRTALWPAGGRDDEPASLALHRPSLRSAAGHAPVGRLAGDRLPPPPPGSGRAAVPRGWAAPPAPPPPPPRRGGGGGRRRGRGGGGAEGPVVEAIRKLLR